MKENSDWKFYVFCVGMLVINGIICWMNWRAAEKADAAVIALNAAEATYERKFTENWERVMELDHKLKIPR